MLDQASIQKDCVSRRNCVFDKSILAFVVNNDSSVSSSALWHSDNDELFNDQVCNFEELNATCQV